MAFTVEDGTGVDGANSYATVSEADDYHEDRGNTSWTGTDEAKQAALVKATDYIEGRWAGSFKGQKEFNTDQPLSFPRSYLYDRNGDLVEGVPDKLKAAVFEYALRALTTSLFVDPSATSTQQISRLREKIGPIETETYYAEGSVASTTKAIPAADYFLKDFVVSGSGAIR